MFSLLTISAPIESFKEVAKMDLAAILIPAVVTFLIGLLISPWIIGFLTRHKCWRMPTKLKALGGAAAPITEKLNQDKERPVPRMGGLVIVLSVVFVVFLFGLLAVLSDQSFIEELNFISRRETWLVIFSLVAGSLIGILDDLIASGKLNVWLSKIKTYAGGGLALRIRIVIALLIGCVCAYWFYFKLGEGSIQIPFGEAWTIGIWIMPLIVLTVVATYSGGIIDGVDGLAPGVFTSIFSTYGLISMLQGNFELATFCFVVVGGLLAFLWYNIPPARFYMSETGSMALTITLSIVAFTTDTIFLLPVIAMPLVVTTASVILQTLWKKIFNRKLFLVAPLHNYFRAKGYPDANVVMRYWVVAQVFALIGFVIYLLGYPNTFLS